MLFAVLLSVPGGDFCAHFCARLEATLFLRAHRALIGQKANRPLTDAIPPYVIALDRRLVWQKAHRPLLDDD